MCAYARRCATVRECAPGGACVCLGWRPPVRAWVRRVTQVVHILAPVCACERLGALVLGRWLRRGAPGGRLGALVCAGMRQYAPVCARMSRWAFGGAGVRPCAW